MPLAATRTPDEQSIKDWKSKPISNGLGSPSYNM